MVTLLSASCVLSYLIPRKNKKLEEGVGRKWKVNELQLEETIWTMKHKLEMKETVQGKQDAHNISQIVAEWHKR